VRILSSLLYAGACSLGLVHCSHRDSTMTISPPLPPAEEPSDDVAGAYLGDGGTTPLIERRSDEAERTSDEEKP
jgi:hypothetical protein